MRAPIESHGWSVASTIRGRKEYITDFIIYYLSIGAAQIFLYIDDPSATDQENPINDHRVIYINCDDDYWSTASGGRPEDLNQRQLTNLRTSRAQAGSRWLLNVDLDERVYCPTPIQHVLDALPDDVDAIALPPIEAVYDTAPTITDAFRTPWFKHILAEDDLNRPEIRRILFQLHGDMALLARGGLFGHVRGKYFVRVDRSDLELHIHKVTSRNRRAINAATIPGLELLHYDALTFLDWREKWTLRISGETLCNMNALRRSQFGLIRDAWETGNERALRKIYQTMYIAKPHVLRAALAAGIIVKRADVATGDGARSLMGSQGAGAEPASSLNT